jgi:uroporphyrinogen decarboxylase
MNGQILMPVIIAGFLEVDKYINKLRKPDFNNLLKVLKREKPDRPTLFEFFMNDSLYSKLMYNRKYDESDPLYGLKKGIDAYTVAGYDYYTLQGSDFGFKSNREYNKPGKATISLNQGFVITDRESFDRYEWPDPDACDYSRLEKLGEYLPEGMKLIAFGPGGVLENVVELVGYENLCYMVIDEPELAQDIFDAIGSRFVRYYQICAAYPSVGALISNDDWGFNTQTFLSVADMRKYVVPWHHKITEVIHASGKPAILHSCGHLVPVMDDIIDDIKYDGKHSFEDKIMPVEAAYEKYRNRIAILGGIDLDFVCRETPEAIYKRAVEMLQRTSEGGSYALGSGNSIPWYVPQDNYLAMIAAVVWN